MNADTITALATPAGSGAIAIVRLSGPQAVQIADRIFRGRRPLSAAEPWKVQYGHVVDPAADGEFVDEVLVTVFRSPRSYTGEDLVEFSCHGGKYLSARIVQLLVSAGARLAEPGEFTRRAFLNGRIDLSQAEAVADLIQAKTAAAMRVSGSQLQGALSRRVTALRERLIELCSFLELELDFVEEDVTFIDPVTAAEQLQQTRQEIDSLAATYRRGRILRDGVQTTIVGKPNVGKSSLLNALLREERAIVTSIPGTTRDALEEQIDIGGIPFRLVDTAGIRSTLNPVEEEGVRRTEQWLKRSDLILWVVDVHTGLDSQDHGIRDQLARVCADRTEEVAVVVVANKIDLVGGNIEQGRFLDQTNGWPVVPISATEMIGFERLEEEMLKGAVEGAVGGSSELSDEVLIADQRHRGALEAASVALQRAQESLAHGLSAEFVAVDLRAALDHLGEIIGVVGVEEILDHIFARFCIGK